MKSFCVFKKELRLYFGSFIAYSLATAFLLLTGYFFYTDMVFYDLFGDFMDITASLWVYYFQDVRFVTLIILPLLTMRLFAEEKKLGTIELLWTYPLKDPQIILGKFFACFLVYALMVLCTFVYLLLLSTIYHFAWGPPLAGYCGLLLLGATFIACGTFISSSRKTKSSAPCLLTASWSFLVSDVERGGGWTAVDRHD
jgi:ABC-2 type transport system permease protein